MQVSEKILEEIEQAKREPLFRLCDYTYRDRQERIINRIEEIIRSYMEDDEWIPADQLPEDDRYILLSFANYSVPLVSRYEKDEDGGGAYYVGDDDDSCISQDVIVNGWMPLPTPYQPKEKENDEI